LRNHILNLKQLGILDSRGNPNENMHQACKILRIELKDLEPIFYNDFLKKTHDELYDLAGG